MLTRCCSPPDNSLGLWLILFSNPRVFNKKLDRSATFFDCFPMKPGKQVFSKAVNSGISDEIEKQIQWICF